MSQYAYIYLAYVSMQRIQAFLAEEEVEDWASAIKREDEAPETTTSPSKIGFENATFRWHYNPAHSEDALDADSSTFVLSDISIDIPLGKLTLVTGVTGSGKSSLLAALLGGKLIPSLLGVSQINNSGFRNELHCGSGASR
jgi:ABC-type multidrug transport system fused ATPase/permease subunit